MDLFKAFDTINHDLLLAKLHAYGVRGYSLKLIMSYLKNIYQGTKVNGEFSNWEELLTGDPQGSVLGPLLCNIYILTICSTLLKIVVFVILQVTQPLTHVVTR